VTELPCRNILSNKEVDGRWFFDAGIDLGNYLKINKPGKPRWRGFKPDLIEFLEVILPQSSKADY
jgi:hypothetical protein